MTARPDFLARLVRARQALEACGADGLLVTHPPNVAYLTGLRASAGAVVLTARQVVLLVDGRYLAVAERLVEALPAAAGADLVLVDASAEEAVAAAVRSLGCQRLGFEAAHLSVRRHGWLAAVRL